LSKTQPFQILSAKKQGISYACLSHSAYHVIAHLQQNGFIAYIVGGAIRDLLLHQIPKDFDVVTNATPEEIRRLFRRARIIGRRFRIVHVLINNDIVEVATFRKEGTKNYNAHGRIMRDNIFGSCEEDILRRDLTINALLYDPISEKIIDYVGGMQDIIKRKIVMIGQPAIRYQEDPIRMVRVLRFAAKLQFDIEVATQAAIDQYIHLLKKEPLARLFDEMLKCFVNGYAYDSIFLLTRYHLLSTIFPLFKQFSIQGNESFICLALKNTDERVQSRQGISIGFLLAALIWPFISQRWVQIQKSSIKPYVALFKAIEHFDCLQSKNPIIPRRFIMNMKTIWLMQAQWMSSSTKKRAHLLQHPYFRSGFDFLILRTQNGEVPENILAEWTAKQSSNMLSNT
jgi:poly(A) polymerase